MTVFGWSCRARGGRIAAFVVISAILAAMFLLQAAPSGAARSSLGVFGKVAAGSPGSASAASRLAILWDVSCAAPGSCAAVGTDDTNALLFTQVNGSWATGIDARLPASAASTPFADLYSASCPLAGNCTAIGTYIDTKGSSQGLLLTESNGVWQGGVEAPLPANATHSRRQLVQLSSVSCRSAGNCTAVGSYTDTTGAGRGFLLTETNGTWRRGLEAPLPANATHSRRQFVHLSSVSCPSARDCVAIGTYIDKSRHTAGLLLSERNGSWARGTEARLPRDAAADALANPSGNFNYGLNAVSCVSARNCTAIGEYANKAGDEQGVLLAERNGRWARGVKPRLPANAPTTRRKESVLFSLSCTSPGNCIAVGWYLDRASNGDPLLVTERNGTWRKGLEARRPANATKRRFDGADELESVSCPSVGNCTAVGTYWTRSKKMQGLLLSERGGKWTATEARLPAGGTQAAFIVSDERPAVSGVSCASAGNCSAIGTYADTRSHDHGMLLTESGGRWARGVEANVP